jgi:hypothetical protein
MIKPVLFRSNYLYVFGLILLVSSLSLSLFLTSLSQFILAGSFFIEGNFIEKFRRFFRNKAALIIAGIWLMHVIGLFYTHDLAEGLKDIRIKLPLLIFPVVMAGNEPLSRKQFHWVLAFFIGGIFAGSMVAMAVLTGIVHRPVHDIRDIFIFSISHIRFALFTCIAIFSLLYFLFSRRLIFSAFEKIAMALLAAWFIIFLFIMESVTGLSILITSSTFLLLYVAFKKKTGGFRIAFIFIALLIPASVVFFVKKYVREFYVNHSMTIDFNAVTARGNHYSFDTTATQLENGYPIWIYVCEDELRSEWNARSKFPYDSLDWRGQGIKYTLVRFLSSKGLRKDAEAVSTLTEKEIHSVEGGIANVNYQDLTSMKARLMQVLWEFDLFMRGGNPSGHSVTQRFEFWKAATGIIREHPVVGVGTGDMPQAYRSQYAKMNSRLDRRYRMRAHDQYLAITVAFGFIGLLYFLFALVAPMIITKKFRDYHYILFWMIAVLSMITEDTLETQPGATFFAFFSSLFLFGKASDHGG